MTQLPRETIIRKIVGYTLDALNKNNEIIDKSIDRFYNELLPWYDPNAPRILDKEDKEQLIQEVKYALLTRIQYRS